MKPKSGFSDMLFVSCQKEINNVKDQKNKSQGRKRSKNTRQSSKGPSSGTRGVIGRSTDKEMTSLKHASSFGPGGFKDIGLAGYSASGKGAKTITSKYNRGGFDGRNNNIFKRTNSAATGNIGQSSQGAIKAKVLFPPTSKGGDHHLPGTTQAAAMLSMPRGSAVSSSQGTNPFQKESIFSQSNTGVMNLRKSRPKSERRTQVRAQPNQTGQRRLPGKPIIHGITMEKSRPMSYTNVKREDKTLNSLQNDTKVGRSIETNTSSARAIKTARRPPSGQIFSNSDVKAVGMPPKMPKIDHSMQQKKLNELITQNDQKSNKDSDVKDNKSVGIISKAQRRNSLTKMECDVNCCTNVADGAAVLPKGLVIHNKQMQMMNAKRIQAGDPPSIDEQVEPRARRNRPPSAKGDKEYTIKVNNTRNDKEKLLNEKRSIQKTTNFVDPTASPGLDKLFEKIDEKVMENKADLTAIAERTELDETKTSNPNFVDPHASPGLDNLFAKFDSQVISVEKKAPATTAVQQADDFSEPRGKIQEMEENLEELEKYWEIQDKWQLISWGLRQKQSIIFRKHFLVVTEQLKDKFRIVLGRFLQKRAEKQFEDMKNMILNFDQASEDDASEFLKNAQTRKNQKPDIRKGKINTDINNFNLDVVAEESAGDDLEESKTNLPTPINQDLDFIENQTKYKSNHNLPPLSKNEAVHRIENMFLRVQQRTKSRELIAKLKTLPMPVRAGYVQLQTVKKQQMDLKNRVNTFYNKKMQLGSN